MVAGSSGANGEREREGRREESCIERAVAAETECLSMGRAEATDRSPGRIYGLAGGLGLS